MSLLFDDAQSFADQLVAFFAVELDLDLLDQLIELRVRVAAIVVQPVDETFASRRRKVA